MLMLAAYLAENKPELLKEFFAQHLLTWSDRYLQLLAEQADYAPKPAPKTFSTSPLKPTPTSARKLQRIAFKKKDNPAKAANKPAPKRRFLLN